MRNPGVILGQQKATPVFAVSIFPTSTSTLTSDSQVFSWMLPPGMESAMRAGSTLDGAEFYNGGSLAERTSQTATGLPTDGSMIYVRVTYRPVGGTPEQNQFIYATYTAHSVVSGDPTILQLRSYLVGWGKDTVIYENIVDVNTTDWNATSGLRAALQDSTNATVRLNPNLDGQTISVGARAQWGAGVGLDGTHADVLLQSVTSGLSGNDAAMMMQSKNGVGGNWMVGCHLDGSGYRGQLFTAAQGENFLVSHCTFRDVHDDCLHFGDGSQNTNSSMKVSVLDCHWIATQANPIAKALSFDADGAVGQAAGRNRQYTAGRNYFDGYITQRAPQASGARQVHFFNNLLNGQRYAWMQATHGENNAADGPEGAGILCQANAFINPNFASGNLGAERGTTNNLHANNGGGEINSYAWYDSAYPSHYDAAYDEENDGGNRFDYQDPEPASSPGSPTKADVAPVAGYYPTPQTEAWVRANVPTTSGHLGSTLTRY